jgi:hypothetical protein
MTEQLSVCLIGHSFVRRLEQYMEDFSDLRNFSLDSGQFRVFVRARDDMRLADLTRSSAYLCFPVVPDMCFLHIGEDDLYQYDSDMLSQEIVSLASYLREGVGIRCVLVSQLLRRRPTVVPPGYNDRIIEVNINLQRELENREGIYFWRHRGFWKTLDFLCADGVHLGCPRRGAFVKPSPMGKYWYSIRAAIRHQWAEFRPGSLQS